ncbi:MAG TPA: Trm112 family protein [Terracidiphilus sp.]|nr:Trm112 family protein [Terracidiphilus sp.]
MTTQAGHSPALKQWGGLLACPACLGALRDGEEQMVCPGCGRAYPVVDGIPVLIIERAKAEPRDSGKD